MVHDMDAGDILLQRSTPIGETEDAEQLYSRLADMGGELVVEAVAQIQAGTASYTPQDHTRATLAPMLSKDLSPVDWTKSAQEIFNQIRGLYPWPGASTTALTGEPIKLWGAQVVEKHTDAHPRYGHSPPGSRASTSPVATAGFSGSRSSRPRAGNA